LPVNSSWTDGPFYQGIFTISEVGAKKTVNGKVYRDVIVVTMNRSEVYPETIYNITTIEEHYYARGVGEIYMKKTYEHEGRVDTWEYILVDYYIAPQQ
jgi:hypothetical protein